MRPESAFSFWTRCLRGLLLVVQVAVSGGLTLAHAEDAAAISTDVRVEDPSHPSGVPAHDDRQCLTCRTLGSIAHLAVPHRPVQLCCGHNLRPERPAVREQHIPRTFSAPLAARPPPRI